MGTVKAIADMVNGPSWLDRGPYWLHWYEPVVTDVDSGAVGDLRRQRYFWQSYVVFPARVYARP